jgi:SAM-dependent methyltransferase
LDISAGELRAAATGSYTDIIVADAVTRVSELEATFDLVISWQALEHVSSLPAALRNFYEYLKPGGRLVSLLSGRYAAFALLGRLIPYRVGVRAMEKLLGVEGDSKFPTRYDQCYYSALTRLLSDWSSWEIIPRYKGGTYFRFARPLERAYLVYENMICRRDWRNLATHYVIVAQR